MAKKRPDKEIEYKETEIFELFPKFLYTAEQKKRVVLFHGYAKNYRKMIRYAANFDEPGKICLIYLVGEFKAGTIEAELESAGCSDKVCVVTADFPSEEMNIWSEYDELRRKYQGSGQWDKERDSPSEQLLADKKRLYEYYSESIQGSLAGQVSLLGAGEDYETCDRMISEYEEFVSVVDRYKKLKEKCGRVYFKKFRLHRRGHLEKPYTHERLGELILRIFPQGAEAAGANKHVFLSPASIGPAVEWVRTGEPNRRLDLTREMIAPASSAISSLIRGSLQKKGYCKLEEIRGLAASPPYGLGYDGYSAACVAETLKGFGNRTLIFYDGCAHFPLRGVSEETIVEILFAPKALRRRRRLGNNACLYLESRPHKKVKQFMAKLWGIKIEMPGTMMALHLSRTLCETHRIPLSYVDERLLHLTLWDIDFWNRGKVEVLASEIAEHGEAILENYEKYKWQNGHIPAAAMSLLGADYSWAWRKEEYERILWQTEEYGPWPWTIETQRIAQSEERKRRLEVTVRGGTAL